jgi:hypothetical protein
MEARLVVCHVANSLVNASSLPITKQHTHMQPAELPGCDETQKGAQCHIIAYWPQVPPHSEVVSHTPTTRPAGFPRFSALCQRAGFRGPASCGVGVLRLTLVAANRKLSFPEYLSMCAWPETFL